MIIREMRQLLSRMWWSRLRTWVAAIGTHATIEYLLQRRLGRGREYRIHPRQVAHSLFVRRTSSDIDVFQQIFLEDEYGCLDYMTEVRLIIDCGANVGYSAAYLLSRYPTCQVMAVEADLDNFVMLQRNLAAYGDRVKLFHAGVWSHKASLVMSKDSYRDGREWTKQVRECHPDEKAELEGLDVGSLLAASGHDRISLLKVDIEGAETVVFSENYQSWLDKVDTIAIELHDDSTFGKATDVFFSAINGRGFQISYNGELTICRRPA